MKDEDKELFPLPDSASDFLRQIIDAGPEDVITLRELIGVGKVTYSDSPRMSAAVANTRPYTLIFGRQFMSENMQTMEDCVFVLWHELTHLVLDHFAMDVREQFVEAGLGRGDDKKKAAETVLAEHATHIIVDCQVNASCYHTLEGEKYTELQKRMYDKHKMPHCFLRPDGDPDEKEIDPNYLKDLKAAHKKLYSKEGITNEELIDVLLPWFKENEEKTKEAIKQLIGNHKEMFERAQQQAESGQEPLSDLVESIAKDMLNGEESEGQGPGQGSDEEEEQEGEGEQPSPGDSDGDEPSGIKSYGTGGTKRKAMVKRVAEQLVQAKELAKRMKKSYEVSPSSRIFEAIEQFSPKRSVRTVIPNFRDRRTASLYSAGHMPVFHRNKHTGSKVKVPCYVDVSGSQHHVLPHVYPAVSRLKRHVGDEIYVFSTYVSPTPMHEFKKGIYRGSGGTDFNPVLEHIIKNGFKKAIILTDGCAGPLHPEFVRKLKGRGVQIKVGWTESYVTKDILEPIAMETFYVFGNGAD